MGQEAAHVVAGGCGDQQLWTDPMGSVHPAGALPLPADEIQAPPSLGWHHL